MGKITPVKKTFFKTTDGKEHPSMGEAQTHDLRLEFSELVEANLPSRDIEPEWVVDFLVENAPRLYQLLGKKG